VLLTPTTNVLPPPLGTLNADDPTIGLEAWVRHIFGACSFTPVFNWTGAPAMSLPLGWSRNGLPIGVQLAAGMCREDILIRLGSRLEEVMPWSGRRPAIHAGN
jgi:amidase